MRTHARILHISYNNDATGKPFQKATAPNRKVSRESQQKVSYLDAMEILVIKGVSHAQFY
jgi:hypothetical protein